MFNLSTDASGLFFDNVKIALIDNEKNYAFIDSTLEEKTFNTACRIIKDYFINKGLKIGLFSIIAIPANHADILR